jgi:5-methylcytosine-specific restriction endonuclease McrA
MDEEKRMTETVKGLCSHCGHETDWTVGHVFDKDLYGDVRIVHAFVCEGCKAAGRRTYIKADGWNTYQRMTKRRMGGDECVTDS